MIIKIQNNIFQLQTYLSKKDLQRFSIEKKENDFNIEKISNIEALVFWL